jgi:hypothetical protein
MIGSDRDQYPDAVRRVAAKDREGFAEPDEVAIELGISLHGVAVPGRKTPNQGVCMPWSVTPLNALPDGSWPVIVGNNLPGICVIVTAVPFGTSVHP